MISKLLECFDYKTNTETEKELNIATGVDKNWLQHTNNVPRKR